MPESFYTEQEVADYLKVAKRTIANERRAGKIRGVQVGKEYRYSEKAVTDYLDRENEEVPVGG